MARSDGGYHPWVSNIGTQVSFQHLKRQETEEWGSPGCTEDLAPSHAFSLSGGSGPLALLVGRHDIQLTMWANDLQKYEQHLQVGAVMVARGVKVRHPRRDFGIRVGFCSGFYLHCRAFS